MISITIVVVYSPLAYNIVFFKKIVFNPFSRSCLPAFSEFHTNDLFARLEQVLNNRRLAEAIVQL